MIPPRHLLMKHLRANRAVFTPRDFPELHYRFDGLRQRFIGFERMNYLYTDLELASYLGICHYIKEHRMSIDASTASGRWTDIVFEEPVAHYCYRHIADNYPTLSTTITNRAVSIVTDSGLPGRFDNI